MKDVKIVFESMCQPAYAVACRDGRKTLEVQAFEGELTVSVAYTWSRRPLEMTVAMPPRARVELILMPHRVELYLDGELADEEWPAGERLFTPEDTFLTEHRPVCLPYEEPKTPQPAVLGTLDGVEGWRPGGGVFVGDCMPYRRDDEYHVLYLKDRHHHRSKWGMGAHQWEHLSTKDLKTWQIHPMAVPITDPEEGSICTGSWIRRNGTEYLFYTVRRGGGKPALIRRSRSADGYHFEKDPDFRFTVSDRYHAASARDPKVIAGADGLYHMFLTTTHLTTGRGCLAHYVSADLDRWEEQDTPIYMAPNGDQPECPDYFFYGGRYYLVYSLRGRAHYAISEEPFSGFAEPEDPIIPCESVPKCAEWEGRLIFAGFKNIGGYAGTMTLKAARAAEDGRLIFEDL